MKKLRFESAKVLNVHQNTIFNDESRFKVAGCGRRFGKSYLATFIIITKAWEKPNSNFFFVAPTFAQARQILWEILKDKTRNARIAKKVNESRLEVTLLNGSRIFLKGADRPDTMRGVSLSGCVIDEFATVREPETVWQQVLRPALSDQKGWCLFISSPAGRNYFYDLYNEAKVRDGWNSWQFTTLDGGYVDNEEIESAKHDLDERSFRQEYLAQFETFDGLVVPNFDRELNRSYEEIQDDDTLICSFDFNVNKNPLGIHVKRGKEIHLLDLIYGSFNTDDAMEALESRYPNHNKIFHTDASGIANKSSAGGKTDISIIKSYGYKVFNLRKNPSIIDRVNSFNSMVCSTDKTRRYFVNINLKRVVDTLEKHIFDENGLPSKKHEYFDDVFDSTSYCVWHYSPMGSVKIKTRQR
ncbi:MAG: terminase family protein [Sulfurimonas sp.]|nr:terminase family protein [Sulfurimonas sp.]